MNGAAKRVEQTTCTVLRRKATVTNHPRSMWIYLLRRSKLLISADRKYNDSFDTRQCSEIIISMLTSSAHWVNIPL